MLYHRGMSTPDPRPAETGPRPTKKPSTVRHTRAIARDRSKRPLAAPPPAEVEARLTALIHPLTLGRAPPPAAARPRVGARALHGGARRRRLDPRRAAAPGRSLARPGGHPLGRPHDGPARPVLAPAAAPVVRARRGGPRPARLAADPRRPASGRAARLRPGLHQLRHLRPLDPGPRHLRHARQEQPGLPDRARVAPKQPGAGCPRLDRARGRAPAGAPDQRALQRDLATLPDERVGP